MAVQYAYECWCSPDGGLDYNRHYDMIGEDAVCDLPCLGDEVRSMHSLLGARVPALVSIVVAHH